MNLELGLASFRIHRGLETEPLVSFRLHGSKVPNQPGAGDPEQASRLTLVATRSLINRPDMAPYCICQRKLITIGRGRDARSSRKAAILCTFYRSSLGHA